MKNVMEVGSDKGLSVLTCMIPFQFSVRLWNKVIETLENYKNIYVIKKSIGIENEKMLDEFR